MHRNRIGLSFAFLAVFVLGLATGSIATFRRMVQPMAGVANLAIDCVAGDEAYVRYRYGSYSVAKAALLENADRLKRYEKGSGSGWRARGSVRLGPHLRKARVHGGARRTPGRGAAYMRLAVEGLSGIDQKTSEKQVRGVIERLDLSWDNRMAGLEKIGMTTPNPGAANQGQPVGLETNQASAAAGSGR